MTFNCRNRRWYEIAPQSTIIATVRDGMSKCFKRPSHYYNSGDELIDRMDKQQKLLTRVYDLLRSMVNGEYYKSEDLRPIADALLDAIHKGDKEWKKIHKGDSK